MGNAGRAAMTATTLQTRATMLAELNRPIVEFNAEWFWKQVERGKARRFSAVGVTVTPSLASLMSERNAGNRHLSDEHVAHLAEDMRNGRWRENGDTVKFDVDGWLNDGQHRLYAAALHDQTFVTDIAFGLTRESRLTVDQGKKRTAGDILKIRDDVPNANVLASTIRVLLTLRSVDAAGRQRVGPRFTSVEIAAHHQDFPGIDASITRAVAFHRTLKRPFVGITASLMYLFDAHAPDDSERFRRKLETGLDLPSEEDPIYRLRERLVMWSGSRTKIPDYDVMATVIKAWNAFREGRDIRILAFKADVEKFPVIR